MPDGDTGRLLRYLRCPMLTPAENATAELFDAPAIAADYLVIGAGAAGMAFVDTLLTETNADVVIVDQRHRPGGHWNDAYPFVRLHQTAAYYGVASKELSTWAIDQTGLNIPGCTSCRPARQSCPTSTKSCAGAFCPRGGCGGFQ